MGDYKLCGGTFFITLLGARQYGVGKREQYKGNDDRMSEVNVLQAISKVININLPEITDSNKKTLKVNATNYKMCTSAGGVHFPYKDKQVIQVFNQNIKTAYNILFERMLDFIDEFIDISQNAKKDEHLIKALVNLIKRDNSIAQDQEFYIMEDGTTKTKAEILSMTEFNLASFLLGIWHFAISIPNKQGKDTADLLCPSTGGGKREYQGNLGNDDKRTISITYTHSEVVDKEPTVEILDDVVKNTKTAEETEPPVVNQNMNTPFIFNITQTGANSKVIGHIENYYESEEDSYE